MKHLPNLLTLCNLFCGCIAIAYSMSALPYYIFKTNEFASPTYEWVYGVQQLYLSSLFIGIAALCDVLDGFAARLLKVNSPIGKDLDSLADVVSFGVAPAAILFQLLWDAQMGEKNVFDVSMMGMAPAFLVACFAALRLAKFNVTNVQQKHSFIGLPTPAVGLFIACFPLIIWFNPFGISNIFKNKWIIYLIIALVCWLMVSKIRFFKLIPSKLRIAYAWPQATLIILAAISFPLINFAAIPVVFFSYIILSIVYKHPDTEFSVESIE